MADIKITALKNGPYKVEGPIELFYGDSRVDTSQPTVFLCRCGASSKKPFCDGTHSKIGFRGAAATVPERKGEGPRPCRQPDLGQQCFQVWPADVVFARPEYSPACCRIVAFSLGCAMVSDKALML